MSRSIRSLSERVSSILAIGLGGVSSAPDSTSAENIAFSGSRLWASTRMSASGARRASRCWSIVSRSERNSDAIPSIRMLCHEYSRPSVNTASGSELIARVREPAFSANAWASCAWWRSSPVIACESSLAERRYRRQDRTGAGYPGRTQGPRTAAYGDAQPEPLPCPPPGHCSGQRAHLPLAYKGSTRAKGWRVAFVSALSTQKTGHLQGFCKRERRDSNPRPLP